MTQADPTIELYWLPLGAGGHSVRLNGRVFEFVVAARARRPRYNLYHSALRVHAPEGTYVIESAPVPDGDAAARGVVATGPVGLGPAGVLRIFRYEVRCWLGGAIPDIDEAVDSPRPLSTDPAQGRLVLNAAHRVPAPVWGRDQLRGGEMWNSNSVIAWLLARGGLDAGAITPPPGGRAPGWDAGVVVARRDAPESDGT